MLLCANEEFEKCIDTKVINKTNGANAVSIILTSFIKIE
jgi:hypothetical protein